MLPWQYRTQYQISIRVRIGEGFTAGISQLIYTYVTHIDRGLIIMFFNFPTGFMFLPQQQRSLAIIQSAKSTRKPTSESRQSLPQLPLFFLMSLLTALGGQSILQVATAQAQPANTRVTQARIIEILEGNQVFIQNRRANVNDVAREREQVSTRASRAQLQFNNRAIARLGRNSSLTIGACGAQLQQGEMLVEGAAPACTSRVTSAVRGTTYTVTVDEQDRHYIRVWEGELELAHPDAGRDAIVVKGGEVYVADPSPRRSLVRKLTYEEYKDVFSGPLVNGHIDELKNQREIRRIYQDLYPSRVFPYKAAAPRPHRGHFSLAIRQDRPSRDFVIARVTLKSRRANGFLEERFVGDYLYPINSRAGFIRGLNPDDRIAVRIFTADEREPRLIGYSEFELLREYAAVSLVLSDRDDLDGTVRTVYGIDADQRGQIDDGVAIYDYFTQLNYPRSGDYQDTTATFLSTINTQDIDLNQFDPVDLPRPTTYFYHPDALVVGAFPLIGKTVPLFSARLLPTITALPYDRLEPVAIRADNRSAYEVTQQILNYRDR
jgi:hypothetical protein